MNGLMELEKIQIEDMIYEVRRNKVMLDSDLVATKCHKKLK